MNIFEIKDEIRAIWDNAELDEETGEMVIDTEALKALQMAEDDKVEAMALLYKESDYREKALKEEVKNLQARIKREQNAKESLKGLITYALEWRKFTTSKVSVSYRKSERVEVDDVDSLPQDFKRVKTTVEADKVALKEAIKEGEIIDGVRLVQVISTQIK